MSDDSKVIKCTDYQWDSVPRKKYKDDNSSYKNVHRYTLLGEADDELALNFQTRYFEVDTGGYTSFEYHRHPHSVVIIRGSGTVILDDALHDVSLHDVVFVSPNTLHQFHADKGEPLGFICVVDRYRDRPVLPENEEIKESIDSEEVLQKIRR